MNEMDFNLCLISISSRTSEWHRGKHKYWLLRHKHTICNELLYDQTLRCIVLLSFENCQSVYAFITTMRNNLDESPENCKRHSTAQHSTHARTLTFRLRIASGASRYAYTKHTWTRTLTEIYQTCTQSCHQYRPKRHTTITFSQYFFLLSGQLLTHRFSLCGCLNVFVCVPSFSLSFTTFRIASEYISCFAFFLLVTSNLITN